MATYFIYIGDYDYKANGLEMAHKMYNRACEFGILANKNVFLVDGATGEILADNLGKA